MTEYLEIKLIDSFRRNAEYDSRRRGVVGDGVAELNSPTLDPAIDDLQRWHDEPGGSQNLYRSNARPFQFAVENKSNFRFDLRLNQFADLEDRRVLQHHVIENVTVIRLIDVEHFLHRLAGEADLLPHDLGAVGFFHFDQRQLNPV